MAAQPKSTLSKMIFAPWLSYLRFFANDELASMLGQAGLREVQVEMVNRSEHTVYAQQLAYAVK